SKGEWGEMDGSGKDQGFQKLVELPHIHVIVERNRGTVRVSAPVIVVTEHAESCPRQCIESRIPNVVRNAEPGRQHDNASVPARRPAKFVMGVAVAEQRKRPRGGSPGGGIEVSLFRICYDVQGQEKHDQSSDRRG